MRHLTPKPLRPGATLNVPHRFHSTKRRYIQWWAPPHPSMYRPSVHAPCICNEEVALRNRVLQEVPRPTVAALRECHIIARDMADTLGRFTPANGEWIKAYSGRKRRRYERALEDQAYGGITKRDAIVQAFVKSEKLQDASKDPRLIQCRQPRYGLALGNYLKPLEHDLYNIHGRGRMTRWLPKGRLIAKGLCSRRRARLLRAKMNSIASPVVLSLDCSRFDAHVAREMLQVEHSVYLRCYSGDRDLQRILSYQLDNIGVTANGIRYKCPGGRMSGDMNTALGNCVLMLIMLARAMERMGFKPNQWQTLDDGDDCLLIVSGQDEHKLARLELLFREMGHELKLENRATSLEDVVFCQSQVVQTAEGPKFVINPFRTLSRSLCGVKHYQDPKCLPKLFKLIGDCELALGMGVPVLQTYALTLQSAGAKSAGAMCVDAQVRANREIRSHGGRIQPLPITMEARTSFYLAFGISTGEQEVLENWIQTHPPSMHNHAYQEEYAS